MDSKYRRTRVVYDKYDEIGCGHRIHADKFENECTDRTSEITTNLLNVAPDTNSMTSRTTRYTRLSDLRQAAKTKSSFPTLPHNSSFQGLKDKRKPSLMLNTTSETLTEVSPEIKIMAPSFPTVPDSPELIPPDTPPTKVTMRQVMIHFYIMFI